MTPLFVKHATDVTDCIVRGPFLQTHLHDSHWQWLFHSREECKVLRSACLWLRELPRGYYRGKSAEIRGKTAVTGTLRAGIPPWFTQFPMNANIICIYKTNNCSLIHRTDCSALDKCGLQTAEDDKYCDGVGTGTTVQTIAGNGWGAVSYTHLTLPTILRV